MMTELDIARIGGRLGMVLFGPPKGELGMMSETRNVLKMRRLCAIILLERGVAICAVPVAGPGEHGVAAMLLMAAHTRVGAVVHGDQAVVIGSGMALQARIVRNRMPSVSARHQAHRRGEGFRVAFAAVLVEH